ncbi:hypothetical protein [uncultured Endozoicomonas sp.]|uniref:hypothetical protein n=1 Tax=uncultured Endozoicomonas sp. TaxID=432652 RepID=UPI002631673F|nr:hypothetical protein [uncultured Endozoicomonas sp.]
MEYIAPAFDYQELTVKGLTQDMAALGTMDSSVNPLGVHDKAIVQIEMYCRMICYGINTPFPHARQHLAFALLGIKGALRQISLAELVTANGDITGIEIKRSQRDLKIMDKLETLLDNSIITEAIPTLREAIRFVHSRDQKEIYDILSLKLKARK